MLAAAVIVVISRLADFSSSLLMQEAETDAYHAGQEINLPLFKMASNCNSRLILCGLICKHFK